MEKVKRFLVKLGMTPEIADMALKDAYGLISEGWKVEMDHYGLVFTTPKLTWWGNGVTSSSRYRMKWDGYKHVNGWSIRALDRKPHWPEGMQHPNVGRYPCMSRKGGSHPGVEQPNPFVAARSIASMISGSVLPGYRPELFGDTSHILQVCGWCCGQSPKSGLVWKGSRYYHPRCYEVKCGR